MGKSSFAPDGMWRSRVAKAVRPSVEALLLAAVALGCAQAGWTLVTPSAASAVSDGNIDEPSAPQALAYSPFTPHAVGGATHAMAALLSSLELNGVRMALDPVQSGAMFTLADGAQRAFLVGDEIIDGVMLTDVQGSYVILAHAGGQQRLDMRVGPSFSFARAMMGLEPAPGAPSSIAESAIAAPTDTDGAWLVAAMRTVEIVEGAPRGWRVPADAPAPLLAAGLKSGDLVTSVNGVRAGDGRAAALDGPVRVEVERDGTTLTLTLELRGRT